MIPLEKEPEDLLNILISERCCFCRIPTNFWTNIKIRKPGEQVACCEKCSKSYLIKDVPSKKYWIEKEELIRIIIHGFPMVDKRNLRSKDYIQYTIKEIRK